MFQTRSLTRAILPATIHRLPDHQSAGNCGATHHRNIGSTAQTSSTWRCVLYSQSQAGGDRRDSDYNRHRVRKSAMIPENLFIRGATPAMARTESTGCLKEIITPNGTEQSTRRLRSGPDLFRSPLTTFPDRGIGADRGLHTESIAGDSVKIRPALP